jgi:hypothetical protein
MLPEIVSSSAKTALYEYEVEDKPGVPEQDMPTLRAGGCTPGYYTLIVYFR